VKTLRTAVIGVGHLGRIHARLLSAVEGVRLVGVVDPLREARESAAAQFHCAAFADHRELLGRIDAAVVAAPSFLHHRVALDLLPRGVHLLVEKPIALTVAEADEMLAAARMGGAVLQVGHVERFNPALTAVEPLAARPRSIEAVRCFGHSFRSADIGAVLDLMIHDIDLALSLVREEVVDVQAGGAVVLGPHEDLAEARLTFAGGCVANLRASRVSPDPRRVMNIYCDDLHALLDFAVPRARVVRLARPAGDEALDLAAATPQQRDSLKQRLFAELLPLEELSVQPANAILEEQQDFVTSITSSTPPRVSGAQARDALAVAERVLAAIARQRYAQRPESLAPIPETVALPTLPLADPAPRRRKAG
jgi:predicted dehydrogenase